MNYDDKIVKKAYDLYLTKDNKCFQDKFPKVISDLSYKEFRKLTQCIGAIIMIHEHGPTYWMEIQLEAGLAKTTAQRHVRELRSVAEQCNVNWQD